MRVRVQIMVVTQLLTDNTEASYEADLSAKINNWLTRTGHELLQVSAPTFYRELTNEALPQIRHTVAVTLTYSENPHSAERDDGQQS
jgi:hypothetical protein